MYRQIFKSVKRIIPPISETELIALRSGGVNMDRDIFSGKVCMEFLKKKPKSIQLLEDQKIRKLNSILKHVGSENIYPNPNIHQIMQMVGQNGYLGMIIDEKYNGSKMSITAQSTILSKISSYNPSLGVAVMVPNSLGPGELLQHYGTQKQKDEFLPKLANGEYIPCFGLTGPHNGSDATGEIDCGIVRKDNYGSIYIDATINKRYITLAPISNLIGIAIDVKDPDKLLEKGKEGVTVFLLKNNFKGLRQETHHIPNYSGFPNGTLKGNLKILLQHVIGGPENVGNGWKMLMECLAVGRGVSLPATALATAKSVSYGTELYALHRKQFKMPIYKMEAIQEKMAEINYQTMVIDASVKYTNTILDEGSVPSVITAIMKQQTTERARIVLNHGMDIVAGSAICVGPNNFFTKLYLSAPVGITVEGSNTLTRGLIIFGQGLNKSHPHIFDIFTAIQNDNLEDFKKHFQKMTIHCIKCFQKALMPNFSTKPSKRLETLTWKYASLCNFVALFGGKIKGKQMISGDMADVLSAIYLANTVMWYHEHYLTKELTFSRDYCIHRLCQEGEEKINKIIQNYNLEHPNGVINSSMKMLVSLQKYKTIKHQTNNDKKKLNQELLESNIWKENILNDIYIHDTLLEKLQNLNNMERDTKEYRELYNNIISVGEFPNVKKKIPKTL